MSQTTIIVIAVIVVIALLLLLFLLRGRKQHVSLSDVAPPPRPAQPAPRAAQGANEGHGVAATGIDEHPSGKPEQPGAGDRLTLLKGLGPKAASRLGELGVTRFDQIAAWDDNDVAAIDAQMGAFKGRIIRDRWVQQARLLARGEREAFEAQFGKISN
jgi:predicted flap endonuclease-1-like 5' DNA nuclease